MVEENVSAVKLKNYVEIFIYTHSHKIPLKKHTRESDFHGDGHWQFEGYALFRLIVFIVLSPCCDDSSSTHFPFMSSSSSLKDKLYLYDDVKFIE